MAMFPVFSRRSFPSSSAPHLYDLANVRPRTDSVKFFAEVHAPEADAQKSGT